VTRARTVPRWQRVVRVTSAVLLVLLVALFVFGAIRERVSDMCAGLPLDVACMAPLPFQWWFGLVLAAAFALSAINLVRHRPALLACGWFLFMIGFGVWFVLLIMKTYLFGRDTTLERSLVYTAENSTTIFLAVNLAIALFLSWPARLERFRWR
jgi:hypothetical protein